jgi:arylsulfatase A-like enzyme
MVSLLGSPPGLSSPTLLFRVVLAGTALLLAGIGPAFGVLATRGAGATAKPPQPPAGGAAGRLEPLAGAAALAAFCAVFVPLGSTLWRMGGLAEALVQITITAVGLLAVTVLGYRQLLSRAEACGEESAASWLSSSLPVYGFLLLSLTWVWTYGVAGTLRAAVTTAVIVAGVTAYILMRRLGPRGTVVAGLATPLLAVAVASGIGSPSPAEDDPGPTTSIPADMPTSCVVLLTIDTLRADAISALSPDAPNTPSIDALLSDSVVFEDARTPGGWTKPAVASILTGASPLAHQVSYTGSVLAPQYVTLAERLSDLGFHTGATVSNPFLSAEAGFDQGFDQFDALPRPRRDIVIGDSLGAWALRAVRSPRAQDEPLLTDAITAGASEWLRAHPTEPIFLWAHYFDPHLPYEPPPDYLTAIEAPPTRQVGDQCCDREEVMAGHLRLGREAKDRVRGLYEAEVRYVDDAVGELLSELRALDRYSSCLIAFASDHGEEFWEHDSFEHGHSLYDEVLRVPLAFKLPAGEGETRIEGAVSTESIVPTILSILGRPPDVREFSSPTLLPGGTPSLSLPLPPVVSTDLLYFANKRSIIWNRWKAITWVTEDRFELFDIVADPHERSPLGVPLPEELVLALQAAAESAEELTTHFGAPAGQDIALDPETVERLRALGYLR